MSVLNPRLVEIKAPRRNRVIGYGVLGSVVLFVLMEVAARSGVFGTALVPFSDLLSAAQDPAVRRSLGASFKVTLREALQGFVLGTVIGVVAAVLATFLPWTKGVLERGALITWVAPTVAVGPVLALMMPAVTVPTIVSAWVVFYYAFVGTLAGLNDVRATHVDYFRSVGAGRGSVLLRLRIPGALPRFVDGLRLSAPAAVSGAAFGEWFGATRGLGILIITALTSLRTELMWLAAILVMLMAGIGSLVFIVLQRLVRRRFAQ